MQVCLCTSTVPGLGYGICAAQRIPQGTWIGPFQGVPLMLEKLQSGVVRNTRHLWEVRRGELYIYACTHDCLMALCICAISVIKSFQKDSWLLRCTGIKTHTRKINYFWLVKTDFEMYL